MDIELKENERIDDLERNGYRIIQNKSRFCFGMDAVLLSGFACEGETGKAWINTGRKVGANKDLTALKIADLGTGTGIIPILLHGKLGYGQKRDSVSGMTKCQSGAYERRPCEKLEGANAQTSGDKRDKGAGIENGKGTARIYALEIQEEMKDMAERSVLLNDLQDDIKIVLGDIKQASEILGRKCFDVVTSNPPYMKNAGGLTNPDMSKAISRHELLCTFDDVASQANAILKPGGRFYLVHRPERLAELITTLKKNNLEPKRIRFVHSFADTDATMVLIESTSGGKPFMRVDRPLIIYKDKGVYTDEILEIYNF